MKKLPVVVYQSIAALLLLATPFALADEKKVRHQKGDIWLSCSPNVPVMDVAQAGLEAFIREYRTGTPCRLTEENGWWIFRHSMELRQPQPKVKKPLRSRP